MIISQNKREPLFFNEGRKRLCHKPTMMLRISRQKYIITAMIEPTCTATSSSNPWSGKEVNFENKIRCPEELTGKNSVKPCKTDKSKIWILVTIVTFFNVEDGEYAFFQNSGRYRLDDIFPNMQLAGFENNILPRV